MSAATTIRRTLPAPHEVVNVEALRAERDRLRIENDSLKQKLAAREEATREATALAEELARLRSEVARLRDEAYPARRSPEPFQEPMIPRPSPVPRDLPLSQPLFEPGGVPTGGARAADPIANAGIDFGTVSRLSPEQLDNLPYGLICLDAQGRIVQYNDTESRLAQLPKSRVIGRNFFTEVAPCTRVREFEGQFYDLVRDPGRVRVRSFDFVFRFRHSEQHVTIVLAPARTRGLYNMALLRRSVVAR